MSAAKTGEWSMLFPFAADIWSMNSPWAFCPVPFLPQVLVSMRVPFLLHVTGWSSTVLLLLQQCNKCRYRQCMDTPWLCWQWGRSTVTEHPCFWRPAGNSPPFRWNERPLLRSEEGEHFAPANDRKRNQAWVITNPVSAFNHEPRRYFYEQHLGQFHADMCTSHT